MLKVNVSRENCDYEAEGSAVTIMTDLAALTISVVDEVCEKAGLNKETALNAFFRTVREGCAREWEGKEWTENKL